MLIIYEGLNEYLKKLIQLVPYLKNIENDKSLLQQKLENFQYLSINSEALNSVVSTTQTTNSTSPSIVTNHEKKELRLVVYFNNNIISYHHHKCCKNWMV